MRCRRAWAYQYVDGIRDPNVEWTAELEAATYDPKRKLWVHADGATTANRGRSTALGKAVHTTFERWYEPARGVPDWNNLPGKIALSGMHLLPNPARVQALQVEQAIGAIPLPPGPAHAPGSALLVHGVRWGGYRDLLVLPTDVEAKRLGWDPGVRMLVDYKTTANLAAYAKTAAELEADVQANLYAIDVCENTGMHEVPALWLYMESKKIRRAHASRAILSLKRAYDILSPCADLARELDTITRSEDAVQNPGACSDYGPPDRINCQHHRVNGGACEPKRRMGPLVQLTHKKVEIEMSIVEDRKASFAAAKAAMAAKRAPSPEGEAMIEEAEAEAVLEEAEAEPVEVSKLIGKPAASKVKALAGSQAATIAALAVELAQADKARADILGKLRAAVA